MMAEEILPVILPGQPFVYSKLQRDGNKFRNTGKEQVILLVDRADLDLRYAVTAQGLCSQGFLHPIPDPAGSGDIPAGPGSLGYIMPLSRLHYSDADGFSHLTYTDEFDALLPDDDTFGRPDNMGVAVLTVFTEG